MGVRLEGLKKRFGRVAAVRGISLTIEDGEFFVLLGPSGCGKTTTLRMIGGLEVPSEGRVFIDGRDVTYLEPRQRNVAMVFQDYGLYPHMLVRENIAFPLKIQGTGKAERSRRVEEVAQRLHISGLLKRRPGQLSGGEKQRVSLARALVRNPSLFLMDEPLSNLDAKLRITMRSEIKRLVSELGITTVYVTHDQIEAMAMASRIGVMDEGLMTQVGTPLEIYDHPANAFVAQFIGAPPMNMFNATLKADGSFEVSPRFLGRIVAPGRLAKIRPSDAPRELWIGVRPENIHLESGGGRRNGTALVELVEPLGQDTYIYLDSDGVKMIAVTKRTSFAVGDSVRLRIEEGDVHLLDKATGENLLPDRAASNPSSCPHTS
ncbi:MAG: ABC transporter ATP-binding protein [Proteobacteria bacterium]|nr:ABC transporter ATP-binding protein [Pseudomonadota bacterium]